MEHAKVTLPVMQVWGEGYTNGLLLKWSYKLEDLFSLFAGITHLCRQFPQSWVEVGKPFVPIVMQPNFIPSFTITMRRPTLTSIHAVLGISIRKENVKMHILGNEEKKDKDTLDRDGILCPLYLLSFWVPFLSQHWSRSPQVVKRP